ncbi:hypothetical protein R3P38DRAFT_3277509 [Favolaschia claudopus]|uniref:Minus agglutinin n=1 Tax=Favolaschia claudopus TaxID=2862362 RepID=A0AAW0APP7_9AGAR
MPSVPPYRTFTGRQSRPALRIVTDASNPPAGLAEKEFLSSSSPTPSDYLPLPPIDTLFSPPPHRKSFNNTNDANLTLPPLNQVFHDALNHPIPESPRPHNFTPLRAPPDSRASSPSSAAATNDYRIPSRSMLPPPSSSTTSTLASTSSNATTSSTTTITTAWNTPLPLSAVPRVRAVEPPGEPFYVHSFRFPVPVPGVSRAAREGVGLVERDERSQKLEKEAQGEEEGAGEDDHGDEDREGDKDEELYREK